MRRCLPMKNSVWRVFALGPVQRFPPPSPVPPSTSSSMTRHSGTTFFSDSVVHSLLCCRMSFWVSIIVSMTLAVSEFQPWKWYLRGIMGNWLVHVVPEIKTTQSNSLPIAVMKYKSHFAKCDFPLLLAPNTYSEPASMSVLTSRWATSSISISVGSSSSTSPHRYRLFGFMFSRTLPSSSNGAGSFVSSGCSGTSGG